MNGFAVTFFFRLVNVLLANIFENLTIFELLIFENIYNCGQLFSTDEIKTASPFLEPFCSKRFSHIMVLLRVDISSDVWSDYHKSAAVLRSYIQQWQPQSFLVLQKQSLALPYNPCSQISSQVGFIVSPNPPKTQGSHVPPFFHWDHWDVPLHLLRAAFNISWPNPPYQNHLSYVLYP